jgi:POT family proton-dependent oligopeptide transporter
MKDMSLWQEGDWIAAIAVVVLLGFLTAGGIIAVRKQPEALGHPKGLYMLFFAEMWERFSYYGMRALLIFYLTQHWLFNDSKSNLIYGAYTSLVYITPVLGGYLADRYLGQRKAVLFGGILLAAGHTLMAVEGVGGQDDPTINVFWAALAFIIVGSGFLKANISVMVGQLYNLTDVRRDGAYTIFYMGINVGAALGTILVGYLGQTIGWGYGFGLAGIGMLAGLAVFVLGRKALLGNGEAPAPLSRQKEMTLYGIGLAAVAVIWGLVQYQDIIQNLLIVSGLALLGYVVYQAFKLDNHARDRIFAILFLIALNPLFWGLFEQAGGSFNLYTDRYVDRAGVPASIFQSINPIYIIILAPMFAALWVALGKRGLEPSAQG